MNKVGIRMKNSALRPIKNINYLLSHYKYIDQ